MAATWTFTLPPGDPHFVRRFKEVSGQWSVADWSPDETRVAAVEYISINESYIHIIEVATGKTQSVTPRSTDRQAETVSSRVPAWSNDGRSLYYLTDHGSEFRRLVHHHLESGAVETLTANISWDVDEFDLSDDGKLLTWVVNEGGSDRIWAGRTLGVGMQNSWPLFGVPAGRFRGSKFRPSSHEVGFSLNTARSSADAYSLTLDDGPNTERPTAWTQSETGGLDPGRSPNPKLIEFSSFDGRKIPAFVYRPPQRGFPALGRS